LIFSDQQGESIGVHERIRTSDRLRIGVKKDRASALWEKIRKRARGDSNTRPADS